MSSGDPTDILLARAVRALDGVSRHSPRRRRLQLRGWAWGLAASTQAVQDCLAGLLQRTGAAAAPAGQVYLVLSESPQSAAASAWPQAVARQCRPDVLQQYCAPRAQDAQALWRLAGDLHRGAAQSALLLAQAPLPGAAPAQLAAALWLSADAGDESSLELQLQHDDEVTGADAPAASLPQHTLSLVLMAGRLCAAGHDADLSALLAGLPLPAAAQDQAEWQLPPSNLRCRLRRRAPRTVADPVAAALALLQRISGYPLQSALDGGRDPLLAVDSLMALEFSEAFRRDFGRPLPVETLLDRPSLQLFLRRLRDSLARDAAAEDRFLPLGRHRAVEGLL